MLPLIRSFETRRGTLLTGTAPAPSSEGAHGRKLSQRVVTSSSFLSCCPASDQQDR